MFYHRKYLEKHKTYYNIIQCNKYDFFHACVNVILSHDDWLMEKRQEKRYVAKYYLLLSLSNVVRKALSGREIFSRENYI
jgi:hypothetical protein